MLKIKQMMASGRGIQGMALCRGPCFSSTLRISYLGSGVGSFTVTLGRVFFFTGVLEEEGVCWDTSGLEVAVAVGVVVVIAVGGVVVVVAVGVVPSLFALLISAFGPVELDGDGASTVISILP